MHVRDSEQTRNRDESERDRERERDRVREREREKIRKRHTDETPRPYIHSLPSGFPLVPLCLSQVKDHASQGGDGVLYIIFHSIVRMLMGRGLVKVVGLALRRHLQGNNMHIPEDSYNDIVRITKICYNDTAPIRKLATYHHSDHISLYQNSQ